MGYFDDGRSEVEIAHADAVAAACDLRIAAVETALAGLKDRATACGSDNRPTALGVEFEMAQSELEFWRAKRARTKGSDRHEGRSGYWLVPREPSKRALALANGLTDLVDASCSPRSLESTQKEIALAVRIVIEEDGVPILQEPDLPRAIDDVNVDAKMVERKDFLASLDNMRMVFVKTSARYLELRQALEIHAKDDPATASIIDLEKALDRYFGNPAEGSSLSESIASWRSILPSRTE